MTFRVSVSANACVICHITRIYQITVLRLCDDRALIPIENSVYDLSRISNMDMRNVCDKLTCIFTIVMQINMR